MVKKCVCWVDWWVNVVDLPIMREHLNYWEFRRIVVLCQTCESVNGELKCVASFFMYCQSEG